MHKTLSILALGIALCAGTAFAADTAAKKEPSAAQKAQQDKMKACNADPKAKAAKGEERKKFMSECLSADSKQPTSAQAAQQNKMKTCNADPKAKTLKGDERKKFMSSCLSA
jgi:hypothetical protein